MTIKPLVICTRCGRFMDIKAWMDARLFRRENPPIFIPHGNYSHPCWCGKLWLSSDHFTLSEDKNILYFE